MNVGVTEFLNCRYSRDVHKTFEYRLYPTRLQRGMLLSCLAQSRLLYNEMLELLKAHYEETGRFLSRYDLTYRFKGRGACPGSEHVPQTTIQTLTDRLHRALKRFFHRKELGQKVGFPRFKSAKRAAALETRGGCGEDPLGQDAQVPFVRVRGRPGPQRGEKLPGESRGWCTAFVP